VFILLVLLAGLLILVILGWAGCVLLLSVTTRRLPNLYAICSDIYGTVVVLNQPLATEGRYLSSKDRHTEFDKTASFHTRHS